MHFPQHVASMKRHERIESILASMDQDERMCAALG
jgi:hypothetical protein